MDRAVSWGMDQGMDRGVWIMCGSGALIHTLYFDSYPYGNQKSMEIPHAHLNGKLSPFDG